MSLVPVLAVYNTPDGQAPCHPSAITDPAPAKLSRVSPPSITDSVVEPTSESYPLSSTSSIVPPGPSTSDTVQTFLPRRPSWGSHAASSIPRRNSYDDDTIALPQAPRHTLRGRLSPSKPIFSAAELSPKQTPINEPASSSESHVASWWKSKPKTTSSVVHDGLLDQGESDAPRSGWKPKQSGSNSIPLGSNGPRRAQVDHGSTGVGFSASLEHEQSGSSYGTSQPRSSAPFSTRAPLPTSETSSHNPSSTNLLDELDSLSPPERLERLRQHVSEQAEEIRGYKRTMELMLDGEKELTEDVKRLKTEREHTLGVLWGMQTEAFPSEEVKPARDVMSALNSLNQHLRNTKTLLHIEQAERKNAEQRLEEEKEARARDLSAIEKECKDPFVVPALLQAFLKMSKMTDAVL
ncbi:uncharacterized protein STEHIDRAFT_126406 [Stereum hirsutum FP-91666 SS1]|uniref:Uncharacterized protein n=1 Tax=Stereum hirsutum (strain FP-91666) TaxID=721885 RepID=R7RWP2_STEHR|nr:uncharacterized protein STEHIDRAFT_126406 [Stereum hirsutum FP-91666 SS1]EIM79734.1 hypothetical protein STEHIDRAFT_126406 [Stereum hirsutum FP-91666 SS1]